MQQWYQCPRCGAPIAFRSRFCTNCGIRLTWPTQQQIPPPVYQQPQQPRKETSKTSPSLIGCLAFIAIAFLIGGTIFALRGPISTVELLPGNIKQYENRQPLVLTASGKQVHLSNNPDAKAVSFAELKSFIREDTTDVGLYLEGMRDCVDFAEKLHNNAERAGIKAAFVAVDFVDEEIGHALNAFKTTDRGSVYIDCTGMTLVLKLKSILEGNLNVLRNDTVAYIEQGKRYGVIDIDKAESLDYGFYVEYMQKFDELDSMIDNYNNEVAAFNRALGGRTTLAEPEYSKFKAWEANINGKKRTILELIGKLGVPFEPLGIVEAVEIYW